MPEKLFYSTEDNDGLGLSIDFSSKTGYANFVFQPQAGWDEENRAGIFDIEAETVRTYLRKEEICGVIYSIRTYNDYSFLSVGKDKIKGLFGFRKTKEDKPKDVFILKIQFNGDDFVMKLNPAQAEQLMLYLEFAVEKMNAAIYSADKKEKEEAFKAKEVEKPAKKTKKEKQESKEPEKIEEPEAELEETLNEELNKEQENNDDDWS